MEKMCGERFLGVALGGVMGLGNALRFPQLCFKYGGGTFIVAYAVCLVTVCLPLICCELSLGKRYHMSYPQSLQKLQRGGAYFGFAACANCAFTALYYSAITAYLFITLATIYPSILSGEEVADFLFEGLLNTNASTFCVSAVVLCVSALVWVVFFLLLKGGAGVLSRSAKIAVSLTLCVFFAMAVRGLLYTNCHLALSKLFGINCTFLNVGLWAEALAQSLLSLSLACGVMPTFAQKVGRNFKVERYACILLAANFLGCILSSVAFFCAVYACNLVTPSWDGIFAAFYVYPYALAHLFPYKTLSAIFALLFFAGFTLTSLQSTLTLLSPIISAIEGEWGVSCKRAAAIVCLVGFFLSLPFSTSWAKDVLKVCDALACSINGMFLAACTCLILGRKRTFKKLLPNLCIKRGGGIVEWYLCFACPLFFVCLCLFGVKAFVVQLHVARNWIKWLYCLAATLCVFGCRGILQCQKMLKNYISLLTELTKGGKIKVWKRYKK